MKKLTPVIAPPDYIEIFEEIRDNKKLAARDRLVARQAEIRARFSDYEARFAANTLQGMPASSLKAIRTDLRSCYGRNKVMKALKTAIKAAQPPGRLVWCPYCGATTPGSHDHYIPAEEFPEFAAHALNIVPACTRCNSTKDDDWLDAGARQYLHFYLDGIPNVPYLTVEMVVNAAKQSVGATFSFQRAGMSNADWALMEPHFRKLKLITLYNDYANDFITLVLRSARSHLNNGGASASGFLDAEAASNAGLYGEYDWRAVLLREMSAHAQLNQWIGWL